MPSKSKFIKVCFFYKKHVIICILSIFCFVIGFPHEAIKVTLPDGAVKEGISFETSPFSIASAISS